MIRSRGIFWWGEAPERPVQFERSCWAVESQAIRLHQFARRAVVYRVNKLRSGCKKKNRRTFLGNLETSNTVDPRLGTRICLARHSNSSTPPASLKFLGRT